MNLSQDRLDVKDKTRANVFNWRGQFTPELVDYILENFTSAGNVVADPFSGSGTVLQECARRNLSCYGYEINPAAYVMSKFFSFCNITPNSRLEIVNQFQNKISHYLVGCETLPMVTDNPSYKESIRNLLDFSQNLFLDIHDQLEAVLALNTLFVAEDYKNGNTLVSAILKASSYIRSCFLYLPYTEKSINSGLGDARLLHSICPERIDFIFTSPPYINVFNYHQNHRAIVETLGYDILGIAQSEIGSNRKNRSNRFKTVIQYCLDMELMLNSFWNTLVEEGSSVIVIGKESNVRNTPFYNSEILKNIASNMGCFRDIHTLKRTFNNKFGENIEEELIILKKSAIPPATSVSKNIALRHLQNSLAYSPEESKKDILEAIDSVDCIQPSPLFTFTGGFFND